MAYILEKSYVERIYNQFHKEIGEKEDLSFTYFVIGTLFDELDMYNIDSSIIVDGSEDKQIDVVYLNKDKNEINILQIKKSNKGFSSNTVIQIGNGLKWFFKSPQEVNKLSNIKLKEKILEATNDLNWENIKINVFYCNLADSSIIGKELGDEINNINVEYKDVYSNFNFNLIGVKELYNKIKSLEKKEINDEFFDYEVNSVIRLDLTDLTKSIILKVSTKKIAELVDNYGNNLFDQNIRFSLGDNRVNKKIYETATGDDSDLFWYYNNGITIICDSFTEINNPSMPSIKLKNLQIVNGCQTSTTLHKAFEKNELKDSYVLVKIYSSKDEDFINKITEATNSQSSINSRDLAANQKFQILIDDNFRKKGYYYERKRNQYKGKIIDLNKKINNEKLGQAVMSIILKKPSKARVNKSSIFSNEFYENVFSREINELLFAYLIFDYSEKKRKTVKLSEDIKTQISTYGTYHISRIISELLIGNDIKGNIDLDKYIKEIENNSLYLDKYYIRAVIILEDLINNEILSEGEIFSYTNLFKRTDTENLINKKMKSLID